MYICTTAQRYSIADARINLPEIVDQAQAGLKVALTRRGRPVAVVVSPRTLDRLKGDRPRFGDACKTFLETHRLDDVGPRDDCRTLVRDKGPGRTVSL